MKKQYLIAWSVVLVCASALHAAHDVRGGFGEDSDGGTQVAGERPKEQPKTKWWDPRTWKWNAQKPTIVKSPDTISQGSGPYENPIPPSRNPQVKTAPADQVSFAQLDQKEQQAILDVANHTTIMSRVWKRTLDPKIEPQTLSVNQQELLKELIAKFEENPNAQVSFSDLQALTKADLPLVERLANTAREMAALKRQMLQNLPEEGRKLINKVLDKNFLTDSIALWKVRVARLVEAEQLLAKMLEGESFTNNVTSEGYLKKVETALSETPKTRNDQVLAQCLKDLIATAGDAGLQVLHAEVKSAQTTVVATPESLKAYQKEQAKIDKQVRARLAKFKEQRLREANFSKAERQVFDALFSLGKDKLSEREETVIQQEIEGLIAGEKAVMAQIVSDIGTLHATRIVTPSVHTVALKATFRGQLPDQGEGYDTDGFNATTGQVSYPMRVADFLSKPENEKLLNAFYDQATEKFGTQQAGAIVETQGDGIQPGGPEDASDE